MESQPREVSPNIGLNDNLDFMGKELHIQTENVKSAAPCILTQVFFRGRVIHTTKHEYSFETGSCDDFGRIRDLMHTQHLEVIEKLSKQQSTLNKRT